MQKSCPQKRPDADIAETLVELGDDQIALGDAAGGLTNDRDAHEVARQFGSPGTLAEVLAHISRVFCLQSDLQSAQKAAQEAIDTTRQTGDRSDAALAMANLGEILMTEGSLRQARKNLEEALRTRTEIGETSNAAGTRLQLAALSIEEGNAAAAEGAARGVRDEYRKEGHLDAVIGADVVLLRALYAETNPLRLGRKVTTPNYSWPSLKTFPIDWPSELSTPKSRLLPASRMKLFRTSQ